MQITVIEPSKFIAKSSMTMIAEDFQVSSNIPPQLMKGQEELMDDAKSVVDVTVKTVVISNFVFNILISGALSYLWGLINSLQIVSHFPLINVLMPANC